MKQTEKIINELLNKSSLVNRWWHFTEQFEKQKCFGNSKRLFESSN